MKNFINIAPLPSDSFHISDQQQTPLSDFRYRDSSSFLTLLAISLFSRKILILKCVFSGGTYGFDCVQN
jgi:hypothetical protein